MPFNVNLSTRLVNLIKKGLTSLISVLNFNSIAIYTVTTDVNGEATITFDTPYPVDSTLIIDWAVSPIDTTGMTAEEMQEAFAPTGVYITDLTESSVTLTTVKRAVDNAVRYVDSTSIEVTTSTTEPVANRTLDVVVLEIAA